MPECADHHLLAEFVRTGSEPAFAELVERHVNLVYSTAWRFTGSAEDAQEITQAVFIILARKAGTLSARVVLSGWLYQAARLTAANFKKGEIRRQRREQEVYMQSAVDEPAPDWQEIAPLLDEAMGRLGEADRTAVVLRFFQNKTAAEAAAELNLTEAAAHKRVSRALEKLRVFFLKRGVSSTTVALAGMMATHSIQAAPVTLAKTVTVLAVVKGATASAATLTLSHGILKLMAWTKIKTTLAVGACVLLAAGTATYIVNAPAKPVHGIPPGWSAIVGSSDQWSATNGVIYGHTTSGDGILASSRIYGDVTVSALVGTTNREATLALRMQDADNGYLFVFAPSGLPEGWPARLLMIKRVAGQETEMRTYQGRVFATLGQSAKVSVVAKGPWFDVRLNDVTVYRVKDTTFSSGFIGLRMYGGGENSPCDATFSNLTFQ